MDRRKLHYLGLFAPLLFIITAILGGALRPGYSHLADTVSELFSPGSPNRIPLSSLYVLFSISLCLFGYGLLRFIHASVESVRLGSWAAVLFILVGILILFTATVFPQDPWGSTPTFPGEMHKIIGGIITFLSLGYMLLFGIWFHRTGIARYFLIYSLVTIVGAVISAVWIFASVDGPIMGFTERLAILVGFQYTFILSILVINNDKD